MFCYDLCWCKLLPNYVCLFAACVLPCTLHMCDLLTVRVTAVNTVSWMYCSVCLKQMLHIVGDAARTLNNFQSVLRLANLGSTEGYD